MDFTYVLYQTDGPVATITLNRPQYRNAQSYPLLQEIDDAFTLAERDVPVSNRDSHPPYNTARDGK